MGAKKKNSNKENEESITTVVLKMDIDCEGCAYKIVKCVRDFKGVEGVKPDIEGGKLTVRGNVDPTEVRDNLAKKFSKKVELVSPQPKKEKEKEKEKEKDKDKEKEKEKDKEKVKEKEKDKTHDKKPKDKEVVTTAVLKMVLHCQGCIEKIGKKVSETKGVEGMSIDREKETVSVKGTMDVEALVEKLTKRFKREVVVVPPKKDKNSENKDGEKKKKNKGDKKNENEEGGGVPEKTEQNRMEYLPPPPFGYGYGYGYANNNIHGGYYAPVYPEQMHFHIHAPPSQMFSDENPNACSVM